MRTTVTLDDDVFEAAQAQAQASGKRLGEVLSILVRRGLKASNAKAGPSKWPTFSVSQNSETIPTGRARELLAEDGW